MQRTLLLAGLCAAAFVTQQAQAQAPEMSLARLDCGTPGAPTAVNQRFSDAFSQGDHVGQVGSFLKSTLLIGKGDWDVLTSPKPPENAATAPFAGFIKGEGKVEPVPLDKDVFGDGSMMMLYTPGHTPGHHSLLVKLPQMGTVFITGDLAHFRENWDSNGVPTFNTDRAQTLASLDRAKKIVAAMKATVIIQHDARDVDKLPAFPAAAK
jgi:glyoxylase-like metal-dependent hydrolase (beta-lactamase superfamily II)